MSPELERQAKRRQEFEAIQAKASRVFQAAGKIMPFHGEETPNEYRVKLLNALNDRPYSIGFANDPTELSRQEARVMQKAMQAAHASPVLREVVYSDATGRQVSEFYGQKNSWMGPFKDQPKLMTGINKKPARF